MSAQSTLTEDITTILDATCSKIVSTSWPQFANIRMDVRREVKPDVVGDARYLPFKDEVFKEIYCDPPHIIDKRGWEPPKTSRWFASANRHRKGMMRQLVLHNFMRFGIWKSRAEWLDFVDKSGSEFKRCLAVGGILKYKICEVQGRRGLRVTELESMPFAIIKKRTTPSRIRNPTHWLTMKPKPTNCIEIACPEKVK